MALQRDYGFAKSDSLIFQVLIFKKRVPENQTPIILSQICQLFSNNQHRQISSPYYATSGSFCANFGVGGGYLPA